MPTTTEDGGFVPSRKVYRLEFGDDYPAEDLRGLVVRLRSAPLGVVLRWGMQVGRPTSAAAAVDDVVQIFRDFAACLVEWNVRDGDGAEVPATYDGLLTQDEDFVLGLIREWQRALTGVTPPLDAASSGTGSSAPAPPMPLPMEPPADAQVS